MDVSALARSVGFALPVAVHREVWQTLIAVRRDPLLEESDLRREERRLLDILHEAVRVARHTEACEAPFNIYRIVDSRGRKYTRKLATHGLLVRCGAGDFGEPVVTISLMPRHRGGIAI